MEAVCSPELSPQADHTLQELANTYLRFCQSNPSYFRLIMAFDRGRFEESISPGLHKKVMNRSLQGLDLLARTIEQGKAEGAFHIHDPWQAAGSVWAALNGVLVLMGHPLRQQLLRSDLETMFEATLDLGLRGLKDGRRPIAKEERA
jgi:AcrR family transcriptional regulator